MVYKMNFLLSISIFGFCAIIFPAFTMDPNNQDTREMKTSSPWIEGSSSNSFEMTDSDEGDCSNAFSNHPDSMSQYLPHVGWNNNDSTNYLEEYYRAVEIYGSYDDFLKQTMWGQLRCSPPHTRDVFEWKIANDETFLYLLKISLNKNYTYDFPNHYDYINYDEFLYYFHQLNIIAYVKDYLAPLTFWQNFNTSTREYPFIVEVDKKSFTLSKNEIINYQDYINFLLSKLREKRSKRRTGRCDGKLTLDIKIRVEEIKNEQNIIEDNSV